MNEQKAVNQNYFDPRGPKHVPGKTPLRCEAKIVHDGYAPPEVDAYLYITQEEINDSGHPIWAQEYNFEMWLVTKRYINAKISDHCAAIFRTRKRLQADLKARGIIFK